MNTCTVVRWLTLGITVCVYATMQMLRTDYGVWRDQYNGITVGAYSPAYRSNARAVRTTRDMGLFAWLTVLWLLRELTYGANLRQRHTNTQVLQIHLHTRNFSRATDVKYDISRETYARTAKKRDLHIFVWLICRKTESPKFLACFYRLAPMQPLFDPHRDETQNNRLTGNLLQDDDLTIINRSKLF